MVASTSLTQSSRPSVRDSGAVKKQLMREITCLERQLDRLRHRDVSWDIASFQTYEDMISTRRSMLRSLPYSYSR